MVPLEAHRSRFDACYDAARVGTVDMIPSHHLIRRKTLDLSVTDRLNHRDQYTTCCGIDFLDFGATEWATRKT